MSIVRGTVETYRGAAEGFLGDDGGNGGEPGGGVTGSFGNASNFASVTVENGLVVTAGTFPRSVGATGVYGDASNYPVVTVSNGEVTSISTAPRQVATGVVAASYGSSFVVPSFTVDGFGALTAASSSSVRLPGVLWTAAAAGFPGAGVNISFTTVAYDTLNVISQTVAGSSMTVSATGLYAIFGAVYLSGTTTLSQRLKVNGAVVSQIWTHLNAPNFLFILHSCTVGDVISIDITLNQGLSATTRSLGLVKVA